MHRNHRQGKNLSRKSETHSLAGGCYRESRYTYRPYKEDPTHAVAIKIRRFSSDTMRPMWQAAW